VRVQRGENIDSDHILTVIFLRAKICRAYTTRQEQQQTRFAAERLKSADVVTQYRNELESNTQPQGILAWTLRNKRWYGPKLRAKNKRKKSGLTRSVPRLMKKRNAQGRRQENRIRAAKLTAMNEYRQARRR
jgi:hypothetical protein